MENKNSFNKRIQIIKAQLYFLVLDSGNLKKVEGSRNAGYFDLEEIFKFLNPLLIENNLDLNVEIEKEKVVVTWYDCDSEKERACSVDFSSLVDLEKLSLMKNKVQSEGAKQTYLRRYALNCVLNLPSGDEIDNKNWTKQPAKTEGRTLKAEENNTQKINNILQSAQNNKLGTKESLLKNATTFGDFKGYTDILKISEKVKENLLKKVSDEQIKRLMTISKGKNIDEEKLKKFISKVWGKLSKKDLNNLEYNILCGYLENKEV